MYSPKTKLIKQPHSEITVVNMILKKFKKKQIIKSKILQNTS